MLLALFFVTVLSSLAVMGYPYQDYYQDYQDYNSFQDYENESPGFAGDSDGSIDDLMAEARLQYLLGLAAKSTYAVSILWAGATEEHSMGWGN